MSIMENVPMISVIVPIYNVEAYLDKCISSIVNQTYTNLEIILVDDGSPDNCPAMCDTWVAEDSRIKVIHKENGGLSDARNAGMEIATGELMGFVDSDDWIEPDMYQLLYENLIANDCDISACGVQMDWEDGTPSRALTKDGSCVLKAKDAMCAIIEESWLKQPVWYKLYKTDLIKDIHFPVGKYHEDVFWSYQAVGRAKCVCVFERPCYHYIQRSGSIMGENYSLKRLDALEAKVARVRYIQAKMPELSSQAYLDFWFSCIYAQQMLMRYCDTNTNEIATEIISEIIGQCNVNLCNLDLKTVSPKQRIWFALSRFDFLRTCKIRSRLNIGF